MPTPVPTPSDLSSVAYLARDVIYTMFVVFIATLALIGMIVGGLLGVGRLIEKWESLNS